MTPRRGLAVVAATLIAASAASAATAATDAAPVDATRYPALAALTGWLRSDAREARNCSSMVALSLSARAAYEKTQSEPAAVHNIAASLQQVSGGKMDAAVANQLASNSVRTAVQFLPLPREAAGMGIASLCRSAVSRADRPFADDRLVDRLVVDARACLSAGLASGTTTPLALDCVVKTFERR